MNSHSYELEIHKLYPDITVSQMACPMWVPLVENYEFDSPGADYFVRKRIEGILRTDLEIDTLVLACTHYPLLMNKILKYTPPGVRIVPQGEYVATSLRDYFQRHPEMDAQCTKGGHCHYLTTEAADKFAESATLFMHEPCPYATVSRIFLYPEKENYFSVSHPENSVSHLKIPVSRPVSSGWLTVFLSSRPPTATACRVFPHGHPCLSCSLFPVTNVT